MDRCFLYCAGEYHDPYILPGEGDTVAAVDGGLMLTERLGLVPDLMIGDFDSLGHIPEGTNVLEYPAEKDDTDTAIACEYFLSKGCRQIFIIGAVGGRPDHTYANIQLLRHMAVQGVQGFVFAHDFVFTAVSCGMLEWNDNYSGYISVFAMDSYAEGVSLSGLKYPLNDAVISCDKTLGVSNEFLSQKASAIVADGTLLIMFERKEALELPTFTQL